MRVVRLEEVIDSTGLAQSSICKFISEGGFPTPIPLGDRCVDWLESEVQEWILGRVRGRNSQLERLY